MNVIDVENLTVGFGRLAVLKSMTLQVTKGTVCALLGPNGAGKTTLIKTLMNIYPRRGGSAKVFGVPSERISVEEFRRIGYISENQLLPEWMSVERFLRFCSTFYPDWDSAWCDKMVKEMELSPRQRLSELSRGSKVKVSLISSLAYRPELLVLDEPFSGLDPIIRDEFIDAIIELASQNKATTFIASHDLHEVERIADSIAFLADGEIKEHQALDTLLNRYKLVTLETTMDSIRSLPPRWVQVKRDNDILRFVDPDYNEAELASEIAEYLMCATLKSVEALSLKDIYRVIAGREVR